ncbi:hypothetical protein [Chlorogloeopsis sp. ULAP02]
MLENYGLIKLIQEIEDEEKLSKEEALKYYTALKAKNVES